MNEARKASEELPSGHGDLGPALVGPQEASGSEWRSAARPAGHRWDRGAHIPQQMQTLEGGAGIASCLLSCSLCCFCPQWLTLTFNSLTNQLGVLTTPGLIHSSQCPSLGHIPFWGQWGVRCPLNGKPPNRSGVAPGGDRWELGPDLHHVTWELKLWERMRSSMGKWVRGGRDGERPERDTIPRGREGQRTGG